MPNLRGPAAIGKCYLTLICWGMALGFVAYLFLGINSQGAWWGNLVAVIVSMLTGGILSALVFGVLSRTPLILRSFGFPIVSTLIPFALVIGGNSLFYKTLYVGGPLNILVTLIWAIELLPFSIFSAVVYVLISSDRSAPQVSGSDGPR